MPTIDTFKELKSAYEIEQDLLANWKSTVDTGAFRNQSIEGQFRETWIDYFDAIIRSNAAILEICNNVINGSTTPDVGRNNIVHNHHDRSKLTQTIAAAAKNSNDYEYLQSIDSGMELEGDIDQKIRHFLDTGSTATPK